MGRMDVRRVAAYGVRGSCSGDVDVAGGVPWGPVGSRGVGWWGPVRWDGGVVQGARVGPRVVRGWGLAGCEGGVARV